MTQIEVYHYDAFTTKPGKGNPAGIILNSEKLTTEDMQAITKKVGFNECAFPISSAIADVRIRYFTPGHETPLCGHATMASMVALIEQKKLPEKEQYTIETLAGTLSIHVKKIGSHYQIRMEHASPQFVKFNGSKKKLASALNIEENEIDTRYPIVYGSTGQWTLCIPISTIESFEKMKPNTATFPTILKEMPKASVHPFSFKAFNLDADMHARHFSSPYSGTIEDSVTGTASGVMGAFYATYVKPYRKENYSLIVEQGQELKRDGRVTVHIQNTNDLKIAISGTAVFVQTIIIDY
ncbi:PhzF family phenazine biosynthesis isomerase [Rummeliibacillus pycnus]|uniref:PhzF family phenazine biosynthesis isomerase n=1 Tax=Rummeliibacillus pycnus TaxID=101070 RepID=UPI000C99C00D|nr:PhzF family phenazine biosynthesis isomerase [Rummeliibacillus pycnus]